ncbi:hypothetical protein BCR44DRAFT_152549 [Catenaria anguillulae PL171]|uniref:Carbamoyl phosphate synthase arginine-specific large chain n=1 Tax=Catenaria anguillulae PL171 TaxID=765915 RepID=A0A1Y2HPC1_9FUNG|nr:hypothetical protein BCR44DRAFT_152549 [Catenaria anguillulae PL171]
MTTARLLNLRTHVRAARLGARSTSSLPLARAASAATVEQTIKATSRSHSCHQYRSLSILSKPSAASTFGKSYAAGRPLTLGPVSIAHTTSTHTYLSWPVLHPGTRRTFATHAPTPTPEPAPLTFTTDGVQKEPLAKRVLVVGSGGLSIGQAGEFDYSGSQAIKALKEEGVHTILVNPNIATVQTDPKLADKVYFLPITPAYLEQVIEREKPDGILLTFGGQTALNVGIQLDKLGILAKHKVKVLGTPISTLITSEDRDLFAKALQEIDVAIAKSIAVESVPAALAAADEIGYPVIVRSAYALGGLGSGFANNKQELHDLATQSLALAPQILVERSMKGWKEVEYEVVRDAQDNCITVCNMENFDPLGVHTGDSIVVAPSQTLSDDEYHWLRESAIKIVRHLGVVGECNVQYAFNPDARELAVIEVNARLSRSSALASKATGYPLAFVAAKIALGYSLPELRNAVTKTTTACFEPALDYIVTKIPRWDLAKFGHPVERTVGSMMKSVGEVMAIGRTFEESLQKAMRMVDPNVHGFEPLAVAAADADKKAQVVTKESVVKALSKPTDARLFDLANAFAHGTHSVDELHDLTKIDRWFLYKLQNIDNARKHLSTHNKLDTLDKTSVKTAKQFGFSDLQIASAVGNGVSEMDVRSHRLKYGIRPWVKRIDTMANEVKCDTNYLYTTYHGSAHDVTFTDNGTLVLGSGVYRIGSSVEFDWCGVSAIRALRDQGRKTIMLNYNPETVSTDFDEVDRLYFDELSLERVLDIYDLEGAQGVMVSVGGQLPQNIALPLKQLGGCNVLGTDPEMIDSAEDRFKFSKILDAAGVHQPRWMQLTTVDEAQQFADRVGYPVLVRPSYVLSGAAMRVARTHDELEAYLSAAAAVSPKHPVVVTEFIEGPHVREIDVDAVAQDGRVVAAAVSLHVEPAGVHSGDASLLLPGVDEPARQKANAIAAKVAQALRITGPFNMQLIDRGCGELLVIECNLRASRSFPFASKVLGTNLIETATRAMTEADPVPAVDLQAPGRVPYVAAKLPQFSWTRLAGADPVLSVEMASTGEVACFANDAHEAFLMGLEAVNGFKVPKGRVFVSYARGMGVSVDQAIEVARLFQEAGYEIVTNSSEIAKGAMASKPVHLVEGVFEKGEAPHKWTLDQVRNAAKPLLLQEHGVDLMVNLTTGKSAKGIESTDYMLRRVAVDLGVPLMTNYQATKMLAEAIAKRKQAGKPTGEVKSWNEWLGDVHEQ